MHTILNSTNAPMLITRPNVLQFQPFCSAGNMTAKQMKLEESGIVSEKAANDDGKRPGAHLKSHTLFDHIHFITCHSNSTPTCSHAAEDTEEKKGAEEQHTEKKAKTEAGSKTTAPEVDADAKEPLSKSQPKNVVEEGRIYFFYRSETTAEIGLGIANI